MEIIEYNGEKSVVIPISHWEKLQEKVLAQRKLIEDFEKEMKRI